MENSNSFNLSHARSMKFPFPLPRRHVPQALGTYHMRSMSSTFPTPFSFTNDALGPVGASVLPHLRPSALSTASLMISGSRGDAAGTAAEVDEIIKILRNESQVSGANVSTGPGGSCIIETRPGVTYCFRQRIDPNMDPQKLKRIISSRVWTQRTKAKKQQYVRDLGKRARELEAVVGLLRPRIQSLNDRKTSLARENQILGQRLADCQGRTRLIESEIANNAAGITRLRAAEMKQKVQEGSSNHAAAVMPLLSRQPELAGLVDRLITSQGQAGDTDGMNWLKQVLTTLRWSTGDGESAEKRTNNTLNVGDAEKGAPQSAGNAQCPSMEQLGDEMGGRFFFSYPDNLAVNPGMELGHQAELQAFNDDFRQQVFKYNGQAEQQVFNYDGQAEQQVFNYDGGEEQQVFNYDGREEQQVFNYDGREEQQVFNYDGRAEQQVFNYDGRAEQQVFNYDGRTEQHAFNYSGLTVNPNNPAFNP